MTWIADSLWHLLTGNYAREHRASAAGVSTPQSSRAASRAPQALPPDRQRATAPLADPADTTLPMQQRYDALVHLMKQRYGLRIRKWRSSSSGCAWQVHYTDGSISRLIESPYPRGPMSCAIFLHEVGHHAIGLGTYRPRCLEEYHAWRWSLDTMQQYKFNVTPSVQKRMHESLHYAIGKAARRGLQQLPAELAPYLSPLSDSRC